MYETLRIVVALGIAFALGSVLPADLLAAARGVDIRSVGDGNPGTVNAFRGLGRTAGLITAVYDVSVGVVALLVARLLGVPEGWAYAAGVASIAGHRFPVFTGFSGGGQGMAASAGLLVYGVAVALLRGVLSPAGIAVLVVIAAGTFALTRSGPMVSVVMLPVLLFQLAVRRTDPVFLGFMTVVTGHIWLVQASVLRRSRGREAAGTARGHARG